MAHIESLTALRASTTRICLVTWRVLCCSIFTYETKESKVNYGYPSVLRGLERRKALPETLLHSENEVRAGHQLYLYQFLEASLVNSTKQSN